MLRRLRRPEAEAVVVLCDDNEPAKPARLARTDNLVGVELRRIKQSRILVAIAPLAVSIGVETPVDDSVDLAVARRDARGQKAAIESELSIARDIQNSMVPNAFPDREGLDVYASIFMNIGKV